MLPILRSVQRFVVVLFHSETWRLLTCRGSDSVGPKSTPTPTTLRLLKFVQLEVSDWTQGGRIKTAKGIGQHESMLSALRNDPCAYCGGKFPAGLHNNGKHVHASVDHIVPLNRNQNINGRGRDHWTNMTACCSTCNNRKQNLKLIHFLWWRWGNKPVAMLKQAYKMSQRKE